MANYPVRGSTPWDDTLRAYVDDADAAVAAGADAQVAALQAQVAALEDQMATQLSGISLGSARRTSNFTTTNTSTASGGVIPAMTVGPITGQGRAVDVAFFAPIVFHSVANTTVTAGLSVSVNGGVFSTVSNFSQQALTQSTLTNTGPSLFLLNEAVVLADGSTYSFAVNIAGGAPGTSSLVSAAYAPITLTVTSR